MKRSQIKAMKAKANIKSCYHKNCYKDGCKSCMFDFKEANKSEIKRDGYDKVYNYYKSGGAFN